MTFTFLMIVFEYWVIVCVTIWWAMACKALDALMTDRKQFHAVMVELKSVTGYNCRPWTFAEIKNCCGLKSSKCVGFHQISFHYFKDVFCSLTWLLSRVWIAWVNCVDQEFNALKQTSKFLWLWLSIALLGSRVSVYYGQLLNSITEISLGMSKSLKLWSCRHDRWH